MNEPGEFKERIAKTFSRIERAFENVDPDRAECSQSLGSVTILFSDHSKCILSTQPSIGQLWVAISAQGKAVHFNFDPALDEWVDDKGKGETLTALLRTLLQDMEDISIELPKA